MFKNLFVFEMANNHQGDVNHAKTIVKNMAYLKDKYNLNAGVKLQFRNYKTFIHPSHLNGGVNENTNKHVKRFTETALTDEQFFEILQEIQKYNMKTIVTPFDEESVKKIVKMNVDIIKIGSPSLHDFCLMEEVSKTRKPIIISSGGCDIKHVDKLVSFFSNRFNNFALMHCVSIYPTPKDKLNLSTINVFKKRYRDLTIGFSTHEEPNNLDAIKIARSLGAEMFEKHVGHETDKYKLNKYSTNLEQTENWIKSFIDANLMIGDYNPRTPNEKEFNDLQKLNRGVFMKRDVKEGQVINKSDIYFAFPIAENGLLTSEFKEGKVAIKDYQKNDPILKKEVKETLLPKDKIYSIVHKIKAMLNNANIKIPNDSKMEISHHYGIDNFYKTGCFLITCFNYDEYAKKILVMLPGQNHPTHYHEKKDETFSLLYGDILVKTNKNEYNLNLGEQLRMIRNTPHSFSTENGCVIEEISTPAFPNDSYYFDSNIQKNRKTKLYNWRLFIKNKKKNL